MTENNTEHLVQECKRIEGDCTYTAEAHHIIAHNTGKVSFWLKLIPAVAAAISGILILNGAPSWVAWVSIISGVAFALQSVLDPDKKYHDHSQAAKNYTALKHDSRALCETFSKEMEHSYFVQSVKLLRERYNNLVKFTPPTTEEAFEQGRKRVQSGIHTPDSSE